MRLLYQFMKAEIDRLVQALERIEQCATDNGVNRVQIRLIAFLARHRGMQMK